MRICHLIGSLGRCGAAHVLADLAADQLARGAEVSVLATGTEGAVGERIQAAGIPVVYLEKGQGIDRTGLRALRRECARLAPDVLHTHMPGAGIRGRLALGATGGASLVVHEHSLLAYRQLRYRLAGRILRGREAALLCASHEIARAAETAHRRPDAVHVLLNGVDPDRFGQRKHLNGDETPSKGDELVRSGLNPADSDTRDAILLSVGRLEVRKGFPVLLDAAARLVAAGRRIRVRIVGEGPDREALERRVVALGLGGTVELIGEKADMASLLAEADLYVSPSRTEGTSVALLEAMAAGLPVIATAVGGTPEIVRATGGRTAMLVPPESPGALADAVESFLELDGVPRVLAERAREGVARALTTASRGARVWGLYEALRAGRLRACGRRYGPRRWRRFRADRQAAREGLADRAEQGQTRILEIGLPRVDDRAAPGTPAISTPELATYARLLWSLGPHGTEAVRFRLPPLPDMLHPRVEAVAREFGVAFAPQDASSPTQDVDTLAFSKPPDSARLLESIRNWIQSRTRPIRQTTNHKK